MITPEELQEQIKNEENTKRIYITPIIEERWGKNTDNIVMEYYFTAGRVNINGDKVARGEQKKRIICFYITIKFHLHLLKLKA